MLNPGIFSWFSDALFLDKAMLLAKAHRSDHPWWRAPTTRCAANCRWWPHWSPVEWWQRRVWSLHPGHKWSAHPKCSESPIWRPPNHQWAHQLGQRRSHEGPLHIVLESRCLDSFCRCSFARWIRVVRAWIRRNSRRIRSHPRWANKWQLSSDHLRGTKTQTERICEGQTVQFQQDQYRIIELVHETCSDLKILKIHSWRMIVCDFLLIKDPKGCAIYTEMEQTWANHHLQFEYSAA